MGNKDFINEGLRGDGVASEGVANEGLVVDGLKSERLRGDGGASEGLVSDGVVSEGLRGERLAGDGLGGGVAWRRPCVIWFTGLSGSGKSTLAGELSKVLTRGGIRHMVLDGDIMRQGLCSDLGFSREDRVENCRRIAEVARLLLQTGVTVLIPVISPYFDVRERIKKLFSPGEFIEVYVACPLEVCEQRDVKGLYRKARAGMLPNFTGISDPYEPPPAPDILIDTSRLDEDESIRVLMEFQPAALPR
ncbi:MAG TPA: adenylyl-sulfate kinase [Puia sp.]|nr:adenylyl-sulfate kinase [Puia sp.]